MYCFHEGNDYGGRAFNWAEGRSSFFLIVLCKYLLHDCLIRLSTPGPEQSLCLPVLKKPSKLNAATSWLCAEARLWCSAILPFLNPYFPAESAPSNLSSIHSQPEVGLLENQYLQVATWPRKDSCSHTPCSHVAKGAEVVLPIWKGVRGARDLFRSLHLRKLQRVEGIKQFEGNWKSKRR